MFHSQKKENQQKYILPILHASFQLSTLNVYGIIGSLLITISRGMY